MSLSDADFVISDALENSDDAASLVDSDGSYRKERSTKKRRISAAKARTRSTSGNKPGPEYKKPLFL
jgi:hypothetical protein